MKQFFGKIFLTIISLKILICSANAQKPSDSQIYLDLEHLACLKVNCEKYRNNISKKDSILILYEKQIDKIKKLPDVYLRYINRSLRNDKVELTKKRLQYNYPLKDANNLDMYFIKYIDFYRVIRYSVFKKNDDYLPVNFRGLSVVDENNYKPKYPPKTTEYKSALRHLLDNLGFNSKEKKILKKSKNPNVVLDIERYLNENGLNSENKEFIKWALKQLVSENNNISIGHLEAVYKLNRDKKYSPKDREPKNQN